MMVYVPVDMLDAIIDLVFCMTKYEMENYMKCGYPIAYTDLAFASIAYDFHDLLSSYLDDYFNCLN